MRYGHLFVLKFDFLSRENFYQIEITSRPSFETHKKISFHRFIGAVQNYSPQFKIPRILGPSENSIPKRYHEFCDQRG